ncbi:CPBP family intramembrane metalloprotease [Rubripirellula amarantea]|nr:CPBP family intramembrane metalloprotease [Rubripirellula amarantea]
MTNPSPYAPANEALDSSPISNENGQAKPRIWPLFVIALIELVAMIGVQIVMAVVVLLQKMSTGQGLQEAANNLPAEFMRPSIFILMIVLSQVISGLLIWFFAVLSARRANCSLSERLGLDWPAVSGYSFGLFMIGSVPVLLVSVAVVILIEKVWPGDQSVLELYRNLTTPWAVVFIIVIGVLPGFFEELSFRGFMQRRLLQRFRPAVAIGITSVVFGLFHVSPHGIALATIVGVWLGVIAWRTNSIWPGVFCHAFINSGWNVYQVGKFHWGFPEIPSTMFCIIGGTLTLAAFALSLKKLYSLRLHTTATPGTMGMTEQTLSSAGPA